MTELKSVRNISKEQFEALFGISRLLNAISLPENLIDQALDILIDTLQAERGLFVRYNEPGNDFEILAARNVEKESIKDLSKFSSGILQKVVREKRPILYHDVQSDPALSQFESVRLQEIKSVLGVPVFNEGCLWGVILADSRKNRKEFNEENLRFLEFLPILFPWRWTKFFTWIPCKKRI